MKKSSKLYNAGLRVIKNLNMKLKLLALVMLLGFGTIHAQKGPTNWFNLDLEKDGINGMSSERAYTDLLKGKTSTTVIVAVIDGGVDPLHEDLKSVMWHNPGEIAGNGIDDDHNGYVDDVYGWNFIGGKDGKNVGSDQLEITRLYAMYHKKFKNVNASSLSKKAKKEYDKYLELKDIVLDKQKKSKEGLEQMNSTKERLGNALDALAKALGDMALTEENLAKIDASDDQNLGMGIGIAQRSMAEGATSVQGIKDDIFEQIQGGLDYYTSQSKYHYNPDFDGRSVVGDNYNNITEKYYGNGDIKGPDAFHGTHVAGIIAADRTNSLGIKGAANNVKIMGVRVVPDGDERDKDVANGIRYAVDNGAQIINMSFGKSYSWNKDIVDKAMKYAKKHGVLLVHAAGNDASNNDLGKNFPNDNYRKHGFLGLGAKTCNVWMEIGALSYKKDADAVATFSNYGKKNVDIFAPGVAIYSTTPDGGYGDASGTSMASPAAAGAAALLLSYYPNLSAKQLKEILEASGPKQNYSVKQPGSEELVPFSSLSKTGATVNVYKALEMAKGMKGKRKGKHKF